VVKDEDDNAGRQGKGARQRQRKFSRQPGHP
jgi:hypothetical protein